jgi:hypothetical protein
MKSDKIVDLVLDGKYSKVKEAERLTDKILEHCGKKHMEEAGTEVQTTTGTDVGDASGYLADVPEEKKKREKDIAKEQSELEPGKEPEKVENKVDSGNINQDVGALKKDIKDDVSKEVDKALSEATELGPEDFKDYFDDLKKKGMTDEKKLSGMLNRAKEIAKNQGKENDKKTITGIMQGFLGGK